MAGLNHAEHFAELRDRVLAGIRENFPVKGLNRSLELEQLEVKADEQSEDIRSQLQARLEGKTWAAPVYGTVVLKDDQDKVIDRRKVRLAEVPLMTRRFSFIVNGNEYQVDNQWQLKPGVYTRHRQSGELETRFNVPNKQSFDITFDPEKKLFLMERGGSKNIPVYPLLKSLGIDDDSLIQAWGKDVFSANRAAKGDALAKFYKADKKRFPTDQKEAEDYFVTTMKESQLRPDVTAVTLGKPFEFVEGDAFLRATKKMLEVQQGKAKTDDRDSLVFKDLRGIGDYAFDRLTNYKTRAEIRAKLQRQLNSLVAREKHTGQAATARDVLSFDIFNKPIRDTFTKNSLSRPAAQVNPVEMIAGAMQTTVMGEGGIKSINAIVDETKLINPSHFGFLDVVPTPESDKAGVTLSLPLGVKKKGREPHTTVFNLKTGKMETLGPKDFLSANVVLPDQVDWKDGKPVPLASRVKLFAANNELKEGEFGKADYVMMHPSQVFSLPTNLIPFLGANSGNRATYATQHIKQSISLLNREPPLVQVKAGLAGGTFEELVGRVTGHPSPVDGRVVDVKKDAVILQDQAGKKHEVQLYRNFPLNDPKAFLDSEPRVKPGDTVKRGQALADTNFSRDGKLALGTNLLVAYVPYRGYNFEDGVVISQSAAKRLSSVHLHKPTIQLEEDTITDPKKFNLVHLGAFTKEQLSVVGDDGVVKKGMRVRPGDPLVIATKPFALKGRTDAGAIKRFGAGSFTDVSLRWESDYEGEVVGVHKDRKGQVTVHVRTVEPMQVGDKISSRNANKGIVSLILPDHEMPRTKDGKVLDALLNTSGVPGRVNLGQVFETAAGKVALKTGKPYVVENFGKVEDILAQVKKDLKKHGLSDTEEIIDPVTGKSLGKALTGPQHMLKLMHQQDKKVTARSGMTLPGAPTESYDVNLIPSQGGKTGGQSLGNLGMYSLLAHGAVHNIREAQTIKSEGPDLAAIQAGKRDQHQMVWEAIQRGEPLPMPRPSFAFQKFTDMLRAAGVNVEKKGHRFQLLPMSNEQVLRMSSGELPNPTALTLTKLDEAGDPVPEKGGLFDPKLTGGHGGKKWTHFTLAEPMPNPMFESAIQKVLGIGKKEYTLLVESEKAIDPKAGFKLVPLGTPGSLTGGSAIAHLLGKIDVKQELKKTEQDLSRLKVLETVAHGAATSKLDALYKKAKFLRALDQAGLTAEDAYTLKYVPVIPPAMRPASVMSDRSIKWADLNGLYKDVATVNDQLKHPNMRLLSDLDKKEGRAALYDGLKALMGIGENFDQRDKKNKGILLQISGRQPKDGFFQGTLLSRRQDLSMRSVIVPEPALGLDEVGLPTEKALTLFRPFVVKKLVDIGVAKNPLDAHKVLADKQAQKSPHVLRALDLAMEDRPVLLKRDPALHKHSIMAFYPRRTEGKSIKIHPLVTGGYNADFDGDQMSAYVPVGTEAVEEARRMLPSHNLFNEATGRVMNVPSLDSALGLYKLSLMKGDGKRKVGSATELLQLASQGKVGIDEAVKVPGIGKTTAGRVVLSTALPEPLQKKVLTDESFVLDKKGLPSLLSDVAKNHKGEFGVVTDKLKTFGFDASFGVLRVPNPNLKGLDAVKAAENPGKNFHFIPVGTHSLSLDDIAADRKARDSIVEQTRRRVQMIEMSNLKPELKQEKIVSEWAKATDEIKKRHFENAEQQPNNLFTMLKSGTKPGAGQYQQIKIGPMLLEDSFGRIMPLPVTKSYSEGLDLAGYWTQMHGARKGSVQKVQEVQEPGVFSKMLMNTTMDLVVVDPDCKTQRGVTLPVTSEEIYDRELAHDLNVRGKIFPRGTILTPDRVAQIRAADKRAQVLVRSPLKCEHPKGMCQRCAGIAPSGQPYALGTNVGVLAAQALGERAMQLTLKSFHCMHEHSLLLLRKDGVVFHTTLGRLFSEQLPGEVLGDEEVRWLSGYEVWDRHGWVRLRNVRRHRQQPGTQMVFCRTRAGYGIISQDNHPHMLAENSAVCSSCRTYPKKANNGRQYYCRKCRQKWKGAPGVGDGFAMVMPRDVSRLSHAALLDRGPQPTPAAPPLSQGWLAGMYCAEGSILAQDVEGKNYVTGISFSQKKGEIYARLGTALQQEYGAGNYGAHKKGYQLYGRERALFYQQTFGRYSRNVGLPPGWGGFPRDWLRDFLAGVFDGDGTFAWANGSSWLTGVIDTTSFLLAQQLQWLLRGEGVSARIALAPARKLTRHQGYQVRFVVSERAKELLSASSKMKAVHAKPKEQEDRFETAVDYLKPVFFEEPPYVYDVETSSGTLFVGGVWTHNSGGVAGAGGNVLGKFARIEQLTHLPKTVPNAATLALASGTISKIEHEPTGSWVTIGAKRHFVPLDPRGRRLTESAGFSSDLFPNWKPLQVGMRVEAGQPLSDPARTFVNPHTLYKATGKIEAVQNHLVNELHDIYKEEKVRRQHVESVVKAMTNLTRVRDPGDSDLLKGEYVPQSMVREHNRMLEQQKKKPIVHAPVLRGVNTLPLQLQEDWMAKLNFQRIRSSLMESAASGVYSDLHSTHPIPGMAFGAEFGLNEKHKLKLPHLANVPKYRY